MWTNTYRPRVLEDVVGQEIPVKITSSLLKRYSDNNNDPDLLPNSIIFTGSHGSGKTSIGRLLARYLNCYTGPLMACGTCANCIDIDKDRFFDLIEIDAATYRGIDSIKELQAQLEFAIRGKFRVVILDEAHQLTADAWNSQLKMLEESKKNQIFIFATTEFHKIPDTIVSRSLKMVVNIVSTEQAAFRLEQIAKAENIKLGENVARTIGFLAKGHMRDAVQILEIASTLSDSGEVSVNDVYFSSGIYSVDISYQFINLFYTADYNAFVNFVSTYLDSPLALLRSAALLVHSSMANIENSNSSVPLKQQLELLEILQMAIADFTRNSLPFPFIVHYYHQFQEKRI